MIELTGKYTSATIYAETIEAGVYNQVYDIINCPAFKDQKVVCMPDVHVGASGPCGLVATIGDWVCPEHIGVDIGCSVSMLLLNKKLPAEKYAEFDWECREFYKSTDEGYKLDWNALPVNWNQRVAILIAQKHNRPEGYSAPTLAVAQKWLREVANMSVHVFMSPYQSEDLFKWAFSIIYDVEPDRYTSYEEALEAGIQKCLTILLREKQ